MPPVSHQPGLVTMALASLAHLRAEPKKLEMAKEFANKYSNLPAAWIGLGEVYGSEGDKEQQGKALKSAVDLAPDDIASWQQYARFAGDNNDAATALKAYRKLAQLSPDDPIVNNNLAYFILETGGDAKEAVERSSKALEKMKTSPNVLHTLGLAQVASRRHGRGARALVHVVGPSTGRSHHAPGLWSHAGGRRRGGERQSARPVGIGIRRPTGSGFPAARRGGEARWRIVDGMSATRCGLYG